jgi:hypothetical protein
MSYIKYTFKSAVDSCSVLYLEFCVLFRSSKYKLDLTLFLYIKI